MAFSYVRYTGNGSTTNYTFPFPYISQDHIKVRVDGVLTTLFSFLNANTIQLFSAPAAGKVVEIRRETPKDNPIVNFTDGSVLLERDLDLLAQYDLYLAQETKDGLDTSIQLNSLDVFDAQNKRIANVADPVNPQDVVTKNHLETTYTDEIEAIALAAATSASSAASSADTATTQANAASASAVSAANSAAAAATALDNFDDRYLGQKAADPTVDNDGNALIAGALYFNTVTKVMKVYDGAQWMDASSAAVATFKTFVFVATAGQTVFSGADANGVNLSFTAPYVIVSLNGLELRPTVDYTTSGGGTITLTSAASVGDELQVNAFSSFDVANVPGSSVSFLQSGTGAVARDVQGRLLESFSVLDFGADQSGGSDSTAAFTAAANAAVAAGARLEVPPGTYVVNEWDSPGNLWLYGTGNQNSNSGSLATVKLTCTTGTYIQKTPASPIIAGGRIENITYVGNSSAQYGLIAQGTSVFLKNITAIGFSSGVGIRISKFWRGSVDGLFAYNCAVGVLLGFGSDAVNGTTFNNVVIELCRVGLYTYDITTNPQIGNIFNTLLIEGCGSKYFTATWPSFLTLSAKFTSNTGMNASTVEGAMIIEKNFYAQYNGLYLEVNSGVYFWQGITGYSGISSGVIEMTEPANDYAGTPIFLCNSPAEMVGVRLTWDDSKTSALIKVGSNTPTRTQNLIFNTAGTSRPLYQDDYLGGTIVRPGKYSLHLRNDARLEQKVQNFSAVVYSVPLTGGNLRLPCQSGTVFLLNGLTQSIGLDADYATDGQRITVIVKQDGTGGRTVTFAPPSFIHSWSDSGNTAGKTSTISFVYSSAIGKFVQDGAQTAYA